MFAGALNLKCAKLWVVTTKAGPGGAKEGNEHDLDEIYLPPSRPPSPSLRGCGRRLLVPQLRLWGHAAGAGLRVLRRVSGRHLGARRLWPTQTSPLLPRSTKAHQQLAALNVWMENFSFCPDDEYVTVGR